jgi:eukaryotic-like serine/threonine-protein kinase
VRRILFRLSYALLLLGIFFAGAWFMFERSIVGRSVAVPDLVGKPFSEAAGMAQRVGLRVEEQRSRARYDERVEKDHVLAQLPEGGSLAKPAQVVRVVVSLGRAEVRVPELIGLPPRAAALKLAEQSLELGAVTWYRDSAARVGIVAQDPEPESPGAKNESVAVLTNRGAPEFRFVMPDLVGRDAERIRPRLETKGFRVGSARYEAYEGIAPNTVLKQFPPAGYSISSREVISLTLSRAAEQAAPSR